MTEEQKAKFCDDYCRHLYESKRRLKYFESEVGFPEYCKLVEKENAIVEKACNECPLNEV